MFAPNDYFLLGDRVYRPDEDLYRVNHDTVNFRDNLPEVFPFIDNHFTEFEKDYQLLERELNWVLTNAQWRAVHTWQRAFNNQQGFERLGDPRADFVNKRDTSHDVPKQEALVCGGALLKKKFLDSEYLYPAYLDGNRPAPPLDWLLKRPYLYFDAVNIDWTPSGAKITRFPQGDGKRVFILLLASRPIKIPLSKVTLIKRGQRIKDPYVYP